MKKTLLGLVLLVSLPIFACEEINVPQCLKSQIALYNNGKIIGYELDERSEGNNRYVHIYTLDQLGVINEFFANETKCMVTRQADITISSAYPETLRRAERIAKSDARATFACEDITVSQCLKNEIAKYGGGKVVSYEADKKGEGNEWAASKAGEKIVHIYTLGQSGFIREFFASETSCSVIYQADVIPGTYPSIIERASRSSSSEVRAIVGHF